MKDEIDRDFYCSAGFCSAYEVEFDNKIKRALICLGCKCKHRKYPTPEQFRQEYGEDVPDDMAVWSLHREDGRGNLTWELLLYFQYKGIARDLKRLDMDFGQEPRDVPCVIACTPFGRPPDDWRPE
jgi:hypothetical protein